MNIKLIGRDISDVVGPVQRLVVAVVYLTLCIPQDCFCVDMSDDGCLVNCKTLIRPHHDQWRPLETEGYLLVSFCPLDNYITAHHYIVTRT